MGAAKIGRSVPPPSSAADPGATEATAAAATPGGQAAETATADCGLSTEKADGDGRTGSSAGLRDAGSTAGKEAWGWVEGVAQRAAETLARRSRPPPPPPPEESSGEASEERSGEASEDGVGWKEHNGDDEDGGGGDVETTPV